MPFNNLISTREEAGCVVCKDQSVICNLRK